MVTPRRESRRALGLDELKLFDCAAGGSAGQDLIHVLVQGAHDDARFFEGERGRVGRQARPTRPGTNRGGQQRQARHGGSFPP